MALLFLMCCAAPSLAATADELLRADADADEWLMYGRSYNNHRYSPLGQIAPHNVAELRPVWSYALGTLDGLEATPLVDDGIMYVSSAWAHVFALDARTGRRLWHYDPQNPVGLGSSFCCGAVHRGVALREDLVYVATLDARLVALDRDTGAVRWERPIGDWKAGVSANSAPLVVNDRVIVGISGGEYGVRGYLRAFHADYGFPLWTTYTIPGPGEPGHETWGGGDAWKTGGGPTWQTGAYDPHLKLLYWGVGNPAPWPGDTRPGDNLWTDSVLAIEPADGTIVWGFQFTPHDCWDYDGNNTLVLADILHQGRPVKALLQSNRNGFFYALDRTNGRFLYADPTIDGINWTHGIDPVTGRPQVNEAMRPRFGGDKVEVLVPSTSGGGNWFPMAYDPMRQVAFIPVNQWASGLQPFEADEVVYETGKSYVGMQSWMYRTHEHIGHLKAYDVIHRRWVWDYASPQPLHAGVLATKSGLVFTGDELGFFIALAAESGKVLWRYQTGSGINASPITYMIDGHQYVAILSGVGGTLQGFYRGPRGGTLYAFRLKNLAPEEAAAGQWGPEEVPWVVQPAPR
jgi:alcohol dehydrogenase (cytochrome c)